MGSITANGVYEGKMLEVICVETDGKLHFLFDKCQDEIKLNTILTEMHKRHPFAGTYSPEENSILNALNVLTYHFFDEPPDVKTDGEIEVMPYEDGVVY